MSKQKKVTIPTAEKKAKQNYESQLDNLDLTDITSQIGGGGDDTINNLDWNASYDRRL